MDYSEAAVGLANEVQNEFLRREQNADIPLVTYVHHDIQKCSLDPLEFDVVVRCFFLQWDCDPTILPQHDCGALDSIAMTLGDEEEGSYCIFITNREMPF